MKFEMCSPKGVLMMHVGGLGLSLFTVITATLFVFQRLTRLAILTRMEDHMKDPAKTNGFGNFRTKAATKRAKN